MSAANRYSVLRVWRLVRPSQQTLHGIAPLGLFACSRFQAQSSIRSHPDIHKRPLGSCLYWPCKRYPLPVIGSTRGRIASLPLLHVHESRVDNLIVPTYVYFSTSHKHVRHFCNITCSHDEDEIFFRDGIFYYINNFIEILKISSF